METEWDLYCFECHIETTTSTNLMCPNCGAITAAKPSILRLIIRTSDRA